MNCLILELNQRDRLRRMVGRQGQRRITTETSARGVRNRNGSRGSHAAHQLATFPPETDRRCNMTHSIFRLGLPLTLAVAMAGGAAVAQAKDQTSDITLQGKSVVMEPATDG